MLCCAVLCCAVRAVRAVRAVLCCAVLYCTVLYCIDAILPAILLFSDKFLDKSNGISSVLSDLLRPTRVLTVRLLGDMLLSP